ncbi:class A beta-lactamase-related serine hydrolase [Pseudoxanthomonas gei]|uniref:Class A beta-lactamase-related serine hydrolase n=1 Tax=Pseudoxanthomonas gei TaxID=1383030 RepID=A0ABX0AFG3_9GAMM|nr:serine hydrolase domain-containing protein [Pseudoxanthomonas gei]NDK37913.1 class A beta-lactamase-related serine hydrolase [Pseudoxanthomonas gei]
MKHFKRRLFLSLMLAPLFLLQAHAARAADAPGAQAPATLDLDAVLKQAMEGTRTPALGALVMRDGKVMAQAVRGVRRNDQAEVVRSADVWLIGSTAKPMTVALVAKLVDRGVLSWDAPLAQMLPELAGSMRAEYRAVTLVQLLSHHSGLPENIGDVKLLDGFFTDARPLPVQRLALVSAALKEAPVAAPGTAFVYCNTGFLIAAVIAERAAGADFEELMRREVFQPLGMASAGFGPTVDGQPRGHRAGKPVTAPMTKSDDGVPMVYTAAGNLHMTLQDWAKFCLDQLAGSRGDGKLLKPASYALMQTAQPGSPSGMDWGVQASIAGRAGPVLVHGGSDGNWLAWAVLFPKADTGVLVVANATEDMGGDKATRAVMASLFAELSPAKREE